MWNLNPRQGSKNIMALSAEEVNGYVWKYRNAGIDYHPGHCVDFLWAGKASELGNTIGKAIRGFKKAMDEPEKKPDDAPDTQKISDKKE
jgi:hypothetical protein